MVPLRGLFYLGLMIGIISLFPSRARVDDQLFQDSVIKIGSNEYHFKVFVPKNWTKKKKTPVILFLHGAGERGDDNLAQTKVGIGPAIVREQANLPFIIVLPQCPKNRWCTEPEM